VRIGFDQQDVFTGRHGPVFLSNIRA